MSELVTRLAGAIAFINDGDSANAEATLRYCASIDPAQCDVWITFAVARGGAVDRDLLERIVSTRNTFDACFKELDREYMQVILDRQPHLPLGFAGLRAPLTTPAGIDLAYSASLVLDKQYQRAESALAAHHDQAAHLLRAWLYHRTSRYPDVLREAASVVGSQAVDMAMYARLFTGIAHAHLGNFNAARDHLVGLLPTEAGLVDAEAAAEAAYWIALTWREEDDPLSASQYLQRALSLSPQTRFQRALDDTSVRIRVTRAELIERRTDPWDVETEPTLAEAQSQEMATKRGGLLEEGLAELDALVGMDTLKAAIRRHCNYVRGLKLREARGLRASKASTHLAFTGPPGTGKTTVAKVVAKIYAGLGIIETDKFVPTSRADFVGEYSGHTAPKTKAKLEESLDGVLFIDEAYMLVADTGTAGSKDSFGAEAVTEILAFMENNRDRVVVIIAGYADDIDRLLETNEGWSSRFTTRFDFTSYTIDELIALAQLWCETEQYVLPEESVQFLQSKAKVLYAQHGTSGRSVIDELGNGRFIRNLMEAASANALDETMNDCLGDDVDDSALQTLTVSAVEKAFDDLTRKPLGGKAA
ncbi:AAA family ATPase [Mycolicibacterium goodii]|uniref:AAA family ATPase n=1 Tax=Mycolicibacterium goodii TaxID=134601 RepID=UPI001BDC6426|nr:AAA family ATPase [Mycolicibacterium goodii]MBU8820961.1 AAA family ATPase [Mycolicibacterium goodii]